MELDGSIFHALGPFHGFLVTRRTRRASAARTLHGTGASWRCAAVACLMVQWAASITRHWPRFCWEKMGFTIWKPDEIHWNLGFRWFYHRFYQMKSIEIRPVGWKLTEKNWPKIGISLSDFLLFLTMSLKILEKSLLLKHTVYQHRIFFNVDWRCVYGVDILYVSIAFEYTPYNT